MQNYIVGIYERPPTFTVWEVVKNESVDRTTLQALYQQCGNGFKSRKGGWPTTEARNRSFEALARRRVSLARTSVLRRPSATGGVRKSVNPSFDSKKTLGKRYIEPFHRETSEKQQHTALILERDFLTHPNRQQSNPELASIARYPASYGKRPDSGRSTDSSNRSARDTPHPHHYAHPEKHAPYDLIYNGLVKSRSASSLSALSALRPKTPPSPHHAHLPINMMAPPGTLFQEDGKTGGISPIKITQEMVKAKEVERNSLRETKRAVAGAKLAATKQLAPEDQFLTGKDASSEQTKVKVKFDLEVPDQTAVPKSDAEREKQRRSINLSKSKRMSISARVAYDTKRSGEYSHVPVARVTMDMIDLFLGEKEIEAEYALKFVS